MAEPPPGPAPSEPAPSQRLNSWKDIASYLKRDESTVRRWETEGLPVHRHAHKKRASVYAYASEIDAWWNNGRPQLAAPEPALEPTPGGGRRRLWTAGAALVLGAAAVALSLGGVRDRLLGRPRAGDITSLAVLPLKNLSGDPTRDYFADGMTEALITELGKIGALRVLSYQSVNRYRQAAKPVPEIARELGVDGVLEGTVLPSGDRVRITANLVQASPERQLWAESYEFDRQDVLAVQAYVARAVAGQIRMKMTPQDQTRLTTSQRVDPEAYEAYLLGRAYMLKPRTVALSVGAEEYFKKALEKDPAYAPAYASLAELYLMARASPTADPIEQRQQAKRWAEKALALDDTLAEAHNALARIAQRDWDWAAAEREYQRAIELNPGYSLAHIWYAMYLYGMQRIDEAVVHARRAQQLDPASPLVDTWAGGVYVAAGHIDEAMQSLRRALELDPTFSDASLVIGRTYVTQGKYAEAVARLQQAVDGIPDRQPLLLGALAHALARAGRRDEALTLVDELQRIDKESGRPGRITPFGLIWAYAGLGENDKAFAWLEIAYKDHRDRIVWLNTDPLLDPLRSDPRFDDLVRRVGLPAKGLHRSD